MQIQNSYAKSPSIAVDYDNRNNYYVTYQGYDDVSQQIFVEYYEAGNQTPTIENEVYIYEITGSIDLEPVIAKNSNGRLLLVYRIPSVTGGPTAGLYYFYGLHDVKGNGASSPISWYNLYNPLIISNTTSASKHPALIVDDTKNEAFQLVWQESDTQVKYYSLTQTNNNTSIMPAEYEIISSGSGFTKNYNPTITVMENNVVRVGWVGYRFSKGISKTSEGEAIGTHIYQAVQREKTASGWSGVFYKLGAQVSTVNINRSDDNNSVFGWVESSSTRTGKYVVNKSTKYQSLANSIDYLQISNGATVSDMKASTFDASTPPYPIGIETITYSPPKTNANIYSYGREGIISRNGAEFYFVIGDVTLDGNNVAFTPITSEPDSSNYFSYQLS